MTRCNNNFVNLQVVWRAMQEEFIRQYKYIEDLLQRCYPGAQISLDFAISDILEYFSDIAMNHWFVVISSVIRIMYLLQSRTMELGQLLSNLL